MTRLPLLSRGLRVYREVGGKHQHPWQCPKSTTMRIQYSGGGGERNDAGGPARGEQVMREGAAGEDATTEALNNEYCILDLLIAGRLAWASRIHLNTYRALMLEGMRVIRCG